MSKFYDDYYLDKLVSLPEDELLKAICDNRHLIYEEKIRERLGELSGQMEKKINASPRYSYKDVFLIFYKCPWLIKLPEFFWLANKLCEMTVGTHFSSSGFNKFWDALGLVKGQFRASKPELPFKLYYLIIKGIENEASRKESEFMTNFYKEYVEEKMEKEEADIDLVKLPQQFKMKSQIICDELRRLWEIVEHYKKEENITSKEAFEKRLKEIWQNIYKDEEANREFWDSIKKQIKKEQVKIKSHVIDDFCKKYGVSKRTVQRRLHDADKIWEEADRFIRK